jgi:hypothetical protein
MIAPKKVRFAPHHVEIPVTVPPSPAPAVNFSSPSNGQTALADVSGTSASAMVAPTGYHQNEYLPIERGYTGLTGSYWTQPAPVDPNAPRVLRSRIPRLRRDDSTHMIEASENVSVTELQLGAPGLLSPLQTDVVHLSTELDSNSSSVHEMEMDAIHFCDDVPQSYQEADRHPEAEGWIAAMHRELTSLGVLNTFKAVRKDSLQKGTKIYRTKWVFDRKPPPILYKARLVFRGDTDRTPLSVQETFSTVVRTENLRLFLAIVLTLGWKMCFFDVSSAFCNSPMTRELYVFIPNEYPENLDPATWCLLVQMALYGCPDAAKRWADTFEEAIKPLGYERSDSDWNLFVRKSSSSSPMSFIALHVDDGIIAASSQTALDEILSLMSSKFKIKTDLNAQTYLKMNLKRHGAFIYMDQANYIADVAQKFGLTNVTPVSTPME